MSEEQKTTPEEKKSLRMSSVLAAALASVTAALLGSTLGVAGTVIGAGVASVVSTVGSELYLRSLQRTRAAAKKALETAARRSRSGMPPVRTPSNWAAGPGEVPMAYLPADLANMPTVRLSELQPTEPEKADTLGEKLRKLRWPLIIASSAAAFAVALIVLVTIDWTTQGSVPTGLIPRQPDTSQHRDDTPSTAPQTPPPGESRSNNPTSSPTTTPSAPPSSQPTQQQTPPPSSSAKPSTSSQAPSTSQTPTAAAAPSNAGG